MQRMDGQRLPPEDMGAVFVRPAVGERIRALSGAHLALVEALRCRRAGSVRRPQTIGLNQHFGRNTQALFNSRIISNDSGRSAIQDLGHAGAAAQIRFQIAAR